MCRKRHASWLCTVVRYSEYLPKEHPDRRFSALVTQMITAEGVALIAELIAAAWFIVAIAGFTIYRSKPWFACSATALAALIVVVTVLIDLAT